jgi:hypothetical protein
MARVNKLIVLDLDATLISAQSLEKFERDGKNKKKAEKFDKQYRMEDYYHVFGRPHLEVFLDYIFTNFRVAVWTAASQLYAISIIENFILTKPDRKLDFILFDYHNEHSIKNARGTKDLAFLETFYGITEYDDMIILDDFEDVLAVNKGHCIKAPFFEFKKRNSHNDSWLLRVIPRLKRLKSTRIGGRVKKTDGDKKEEPDESPETATPGRLKASPALPESAAEPHRGAPASPGSAASPESAAKPQASDVPEPVI